ncbi:MAG: SNF2-related protein [Verrucomicrobiota bacterium]
MTEAQLTESFLAQIAGWEAMKQARALLQTGAVLSSNWSPPILRGVVQEGSTSYRAGLLIKSTIDIENVCHCRQSREWGTICAHSVAVGLHHLKGGPEQSSSISANAHPTITKDIPPAKPTQRIKRASADEAGEPAELHLIFPPNLSLALDKGKVMLCLETKWKNGRMPLSSLPLATSFQFAECDSRFLDELEKISPTEIPAMLMLNPELLAEVLSTLVEHPRLTIGKSQSLQVLREPLRLKLKFNLENSGEISVAANEKDISLKMISSTVGVWSFRDGTFQLLPKCAAEILSVIQHAPRFDPPGYHIQLARSHVPQFLSRDWPALQSNCEIEANFSLEYFSLAPQSPKFFLHLAGGLAQLHAQLQCTYGNRIMTVGVTSKDETLWLPDPNNPLRYSTRDLAAEQNALGRLLRSGFTGPDAQGRYQLLGQDKVLNFFAREYPRLLKEWSVTLEERLQFSTTKNLEWVEPQFQVTSSGVQWFDLNISFSSNSGERFSPTEIQRLVLSGQSHTRLKNGKIAVIDTGAVEELQEVLLDAAPQQHAQGYRLNNAQAGFLESTLREKNGWQIQAPADWSLRAKQQSGETKIECPPLGDLESVLRPYQKQGVAWMHFLRGNGFGGILADEMGLGKTLQALAFLRTCCQRPAGRSEKEKTGSGTLAARWLVVCPTSLVFNWVNEAQKFTPELKVLAVHGADRHSLFEKISKTDLVVTSYALIRRDAEKYRDLEFDTVILDEAQHIKNRQTQNAHAVKAIRSQHRLVLTGTPLENSVLDLWSIFDFLMPGYLGSAKDFKDRYEIPITREKNVEVQSRLARRLKPFLQRRLKRDVAKDLPEKLEQVSFCDLTKDQTAVYQQILEATRREVGHAVDAQGLQKSRMIVLTALLRLRQVCCDLRLLKLAGNESETQRLTNEDSGKMETFSELLEEVLDGGHRVLVFSQFVSMLTLLKEKLSGERIEFCYLDGSTKNRGEVVARFQSNENIPVFLISLKAGGVGLNLTGADTVIHFDPWWNPAVEDQATDRVHRIGQTRVVTSYKLIARGTVEEKILTLQSRKRDVIKATLAGEEQLAESLTWEEIQELLQ